MEFDQLIEQKMRNIFLEKSTTKWARETNPRPFFRKSKLNISLYQKSAHTKKLKTGNYLNFIE